MLAVSQNYKDATESETRNIKARITMKGVTYTNSDIFNVEYNSGSITGETFNIGSTFSNNIKVTFSSIIEELLLDDQVKLEFGVVLSDSTIEYVKMGTFFITSYDPQRNDFKTVIEASDKMIQLNGTYESELSYPSTIKKVALEIANKAGLLVNETSFARLSDMPINEPIGYTYRQALGLIAQFECGFALFDRNGLLDIRMLSDPEYTVNPDSYFSKGLTKDETNYQIGGINCKVVTKDGDSSETTTLQSGSTSGAQIYLENNVMTQTLLDGMYQKIRTVNYFPFTLNWRGNPALEAGDWITVVDIRGNRFKVPNLNYKLSFSGGLKAVSSANTQTVSASSYQYKGNLQQQIYELSGRIGAAGNHIYDGNAQPILPKEGDLWFKPNGPDTEIRIYQNGEWVFQVSTATNPEIAEAIEQAQTEATEAKTAAQDAVDKANASVAAVQANTQLITDVNAIANNAKSQAQTAATNAQTALTNANTANDNANKAISDAGKLSEDVLVLDTIANQAKSDADTALINANKGITDAKTALDKATGVDTRVTTEITNVNNTLAAKANSTTVDALSDTVSSQGTAISQNATDIKLKADSTVVNAIKGTVDSQGTLISQNASDIKIKADKSSVDTLSGRVLANETAIDVTAQGVSTLVTKTDNTNTSLSQFKQDYEGFKGTVYSKTQTDTKISTVQSTVDNFKTTVSNTYSSKTETDNKVAAVQANVDKLGTNIAYAWSLDGKNKFMRLWSENLLNQSWGIDLTYNYQTPAWTYGESGVSGGALNRYKHSYYKNGNGLLYTLTNSANSSVENYASSEIVSVKPNTKYTFSLKGFNSVNLTGFDVFFLGSKTKPDSVWPFDFVHQIISNDKLSAGTLDSRTVTFTTAADEKFGYIRIDNNGSSASSVSVLYFIETYLAEYKEGLTPLPSLQDDYDNAVPRYIGRSLKDSNSPTDYKWEPNPERKPWTAYAQDVNGKGLSLMPYGENLLANSRNSPRIAGYQNTNAGTVSNTNDGTGIRVTYVSGEHYFRFNVPTNSDMGGFKAGKTYILSSKIRGKRDISSRFQIQLVNGSWINFDTGVQDYSINETLDTYVISIVTIPSNAIAVYASYQHYNQVEGDWFELRDTKLELANTMGIPTPWTPAPSEDPLGAIPKYIGTAALPYDDWTKYDWRLSSDWNQVKTSTEFEQTDKEIALKADQTTVNTITGRVSTAEGSISTIAGQIALKANQADVNTIGGKVSSLESSFTVQSGQITALNTKTDGQTTQIGSLQSSYNGLISTVADTYLTKTDATNTYPTKTSVASQISQSATAVTSNVQSWTDNRLTSYSTTQQTTDSITNAVANKADKSQITQLATDINLRVTKGDVTSQINIEAGRTLIDTKQLLLNADTVKFTGSAFIPNAMIQNLSAEKITAGTLNAANVNVINLNARALTAGTISGTNLSMNLDTGAVQFQKGVIKKEDSRFSIDITNGVIESYSPNGGYTLKDGEISFRDISAQSPSSIEKYGSISYDWFPGGLFSSSFDAISVKGTAGWGIGTANAKKGFLAESTLGTFIGGNNKRCSVFAEEVLELYGGKTFGSGISQGQAMVRVGVTNSGSAGGDGIDISANQLRIYTKSFSVSLPDQASIVAGEISMAGKCSVLGNLSVTGSKNAIHVTRDGVRATPAYETAESYLGDIGRNYTRENCEVWVEIDQLFSDTVNTDIAYEVFLQAYDDARFWVSDFKSDKFLVKSDKPMSRFAWEIKAKRRGYENERLVLQKDIDYEKIEKEWRNI